MDAAPAPATSEAGESLAETTEAMTPSTSGTETPDESSTSSTESSTGTDMSCSPGELRCDGDIPQYCTRDGLWLGTNACPTACSDGACTDGCAPGQERCFGVVPQTCDGNGSWIDGEPCPVVCLEAQCTGVCDEGRAGQCFERTLDIRATTTGVHEPGFAVVLTNFGSLQHKLGDYAGALKSFDRAVAILEATLGPKHPHLATALVRLADLYVDKLDVARASETLERAVEIFAANDGVQDGELDAHFALAQALAKTGHRDRAIGEAVAAADGYRQAGPRAAASLAEVEAWVAHQRDAARRDLVR